MRPVLRINRFVFFETDVTEPIPIMRAQIPLEIRPARLEDSETLADGFRAGGIAPEEVRRRVGRGEVCIVALSEGGELVHFQWIAFSARWLNEIGVTLLVAEGEAYTYNAVTLPGGGTGFILPSALTSITTSAR
jgi:hypothetical protein